MEPTGSMIRKMPSFAPGGALPLVASAFEATESERDNAIHGALVRPFFVV